MSNVYARPLSEPDIQRGRNVSNLITLTKPEPIKAIPPLLSFSYMNAGSVKNKTTGFYDYIVSNDIDVMALTETWLYSDEQENSVYINKLVPKGYRFVHTPRQDGRVGGGVGLLCRKNIKLRAQKPRNSVVSGITQFEYQECILSITKDQRSNILLFVVYRPPPTSVNKLSIKAFWRDWKKFLAALARDHKSFLIVGDLNFHLDDVHDADTVKFNGILHDFNLVQLVQEPTHTAGHILDVAITQSESNFINLNAISVHDPGISDLSGVISRTHHYAVSFSLKYNKPSPEYKTVSYRNIANLDEDAFLADLNGCNLVNQLQQFSDIDRMVDVFITSTVSVLDHHAPILKKTFPDRPSNSWYTTALKLQKKEKRRLERQWIKSGLESHRLEFRKYCAFYAKSLNSARIKKTQDTVIECERDKNKLFKVCRSILDLPKDSIMLEGCNDDKETADAFSSYFKSKVEGISSDLDAEAACLDDVLPASSKLASLSKTSAVPKLSCFRLLSIDQVKKLIVTSKNKSCSLDLVPVRVIKKYPSQFAPIIHKIINCSLQSGIVPTSFKSAIVFPSLKSHDLDPSDPASYRPVSNLPYLSKLLEKAVYEQLEEHLTKHSLLPASQSAYRKRHSTETSLLKVNNDILSALNQGKSTLVVTLDISAAFDTVNHQMLLERYADLFGLDETVLSWFASYLSNRSQAVQVGKHLSKFIEMLCGFAQGSTLGGPKYNMFSSPVYELTDAHEIPHEGYADDSNLYISFDMKNEAETRSCINKMENCLLDITRWMLMNKLKLNGSKTEAVIFHPPRTSVNYQQLSINVGNDRIDISQEMKSLGVTLDCRMKLAKHVNLTTRTAFFHLRRISRVRKQLNRSISETLVNCFITSRLDYCNSLLVALPNCTIQKLQYVQNAAAKLIMLKRKRDHVTPLLKELHWLPIRYRTQFKILVLTWKILNNLAPMNISGMISEYKPTINLRSRNECYLIRPYIPKNCSGHRAFQNISPFLWNSIPFAVRKSKTIAEFKSKLKHHFFIEHFGS